MASTFRYLLACGEVKQNQGLLVLEHVVDTILMPRQDLPCDIELFAVVGLNMSRTAWNKSLDLLSWQMGEHDGQKAALVHVKNALALPSVEGFTSVSFAIRVPIATRGTYGLDLLDRDGVFGASEEIATFEYGVEYAD